MHEFINRLTTSQLLELLNRYGLKAQYRNPQRRRPALMRTLRAFWVNSPLEDCAICLEQNSVDRMVITPCSHLFCDTCLLPYVQTKESCPMCRSHCCYIRIISQLSKERFMKVRHLIQSQRASESMENPLMIIIERNEEPQHIQVVSVIACKCVIYIVNIFIIYLAFHMVVSYIISHNSLVMY
jgi:hypothetical protein